jgi:Protein of unknown function (DUF3455)
MTSFGFGGVLIRGSLAAVIFGTAGLATANAGPAGEGAAPMRPVVPPAIAVPSDAKLTLKAHAVGAQIYVCAAAPAAPAVPAGPAASAGAKPTWTLKQPDATLFDASGAAIGSHGAGPIWKAKDGSSVTGKKTADAPAPVATAIPWLLVAAVSHSGTGVFSRVTHVQRVNTSGGKPPAAGCDAAALGTEKRVDYNADYYFFEGTGGH